MMPLNISRVILNSVYEVWLGFSQSNKPTERKKSQKHSRPSLHSKMRSTL